LVDALADVLKVTRISGSVLAHVHAHEPWGLDLALPNGAALHAVTPDRYGSRRTANRRGD
jgi:hypothetical protein